MKKLSGFYSTPKESYDKRLRVQRIQFQFRRAVSVHWEPGSLTQIDVRLLLDPLTCGGGVCVRAAW